MIRLVLFDIDGTLIRTGGAGIKAFGHSFSTAFGFPNGADCMSFAGRTDLSLVREYFALHGKQVCSADFQNFIEHYVFWLDHLLPQTGGSVCPGVLEFIRELKNLSPAPCLGLLTGNIRLGAEIKLRHYGLWDHFQTGAFADDHEDRNQIAVIARERGAKALGKKLRNHEVLVVGDTPLDVQCARAIGAKALAVATGGASYDGLKSSNPDWLVKNLTEITVADICPK